MGKLTVAGFALIVLILVKLTFWGGLLYIAWHFLSKYW
jgi:hypothetical protein